MGNAGQSSPEKEKPTRGDLQIPRSLCEEFLGVVVGRPTWESRGSQSSEVTDQSVRELQTVPEVQRLYLIVRHVRKV